MSFVLLGDVERHNIGVDVGPDAELFGRTWFWFGTIVLALREWEDFGESARGFERVARASL